MVLAAQIIPSSLPRKDHVSSEDISKEPSISREELVSEKDAIKSPRIPENRQPDLLHSVLREASFRNAALQLEETTELTAKAGRSQGGAEGVVEAFSRKGQQLDATSGAKSGGEERKEAAGEQELKVSESKDL